MADEFDGANVTAAMKWDAEVLKIIEEYAQLDAESHKLSDKRADLRARAESKHGIESYDLQSAVHKLKRMNKTQREASDEMISRIVKASEGRQAELWPVDYERMQKRTARAAEKQAKMDKAAGKETAAEQERRLAADANPRNAPKDSSAVLPEGEDPEQALGDEVLKGLAPATAAAKKAAKKSQSEIAQAARDKAGMN